MFTVSWNQAAEYDKSAVALNGYFYTDKTYAQYAIPTKPAVNFSGSGATLDAAIKAVEAQINARHSTTIDKAIEAQLADFKAAVSK